MAPGTISARIGLNSFSSVMCFHDKWNRKVRFRQRSVWPSCVEMSGACRQMPCDARGGELCSVGEAAERAEAGRGSQTYEVEAGNGRLEVGVEDRGVVHFVYLAA